MVAAALLVAGCKRPVEDQGGEACGFSPGELVITEFMAAPDGGGEWLELYNATDSPLILNRAVVEAAGSGEPRAIALTDAPTIPSHAYFVVGNNTPADFSYGNALNLNDTNGSIAISCNGVVADQVHYGADELLPKPAKGRSLSLDGAAIALGVPRDNPDYWCPGTDAYADTDRGTPGAANPPCGIAFCAEQGGPRQVVPAAVGELSIEEIFADPLAGDPPDGQWLEVLVKGGSPFDLNGLFIDDVNANGTLRRWRVADTACLTAAPGRRLVIRFAADEAARSAVEADAWAYGDNGGIYKDAATLTLRHGGDVVDAVDLDDAQPGASLSRDPHSGAFCSARSAVPLGTTGEKGSPGAANDPCGPACFAGDQLRRLRPPTPGDLVISEVMANPAGADAGREWLELYTAAATAVDLNGLRLIDTREVNGYSRDAIVEGEACVAAEPGSYVVLGGAEVAATGIEGAVVVPGLALYNDAATLTLEGVDGTVDSARLPDAVSGSATVLDRNRLDAASNDDPAAFCTARSSGYFDGTGTPGAANEPCGDFCLADGQWRATVPPAMGDLVVNEVYRGEAAKQDWLELYVAAPHAIDLNGLALDHENTRGNIRQWTVTATADCAVGRPGEYVVLAAPQANALGVVANAVVNDMDFYSDQGSLTLTRDDTVVDTAVFPKPVPLVAVGLSDPGADNDVPANWCDGTAVRAPFLQTGSPGAINDGCQ